VAYACNPSYPGGRNQDDCGSNPAQAYSSVRPYLEKKPSQKRAGGVAQGVGPEFKPWYCKKKLKKGSLSYKCPNKNCYELGANGSLLQS
jgi:hypothetical protein